MKSLITWIALSTFVVLSTVATLVWLRHDTEQHLIQAAGVDARTLCLQEIQSRVRGTTYVEETLRGYGVVTRDYPSWRRGDRFPINVHCAADSNGVNLFEVTGG